MRQLKLIFSILFLFHNIASQTANTWYFGVNNGINFNSNPPSVLSNGQCVNSDYTSTISDNQGNLLFYTDGVTVWNRQHAIMPNGSGLIGNITAGQCALIIPIPNDPNRYVIFHTTEFSAPGYLSYTVVDMSLNAGLGDVILNQKNISLGSGWTEKMCAIYNQSNSSYWILAHKWQSDQFVAFNVTNAAIATQSVVTAIGSVHNCGTYSAAHDAMGQLTISTDGSKVINALTCQDKFELFDFNVATGVLSNSIAITGNGGNAWGTAFSPDCKKLYLNSIFGQSVFQYDLTNYNQAAIMASKFAVATVSASGYNFAYMELAPNGKIYIAKPNMSSLAVVDSPNNIGSGSNFLMNGQVLTGNCQWGLSRIAYNIPRIDNHTGLKKFTDSKSIKIFPNPAKDILKIEFEKPTSTINKLTIVNSLGELMYSELINCEKKNGSSQYIDVNFLNQGIYYLTVQNENNSQTFKFFKE